MSSLERSTDTIGLQHAPGADSAAVLAGNLPLTGESDINFWREDRPRPAPPEDPPNAIWYAPSAAYARVMGIPLRRGRFLTEQDVAGAPFVVVVNDIVATRVFPNEDPIGKRVHIEFFDQSAEIVGVVGSVKQFGLDASSDYNEHCQIYLPFAQVPDRLMPTLAKNTSVVVRTVVPPQSVVGAVRQEVRAVDPRQVMYGEKTMLEQLDGTMAFRQFSMTLLTVFAVLAFFLACIGVYGGMASLIGERTHEIGVRTALGARRGQILLDVVGRGARLVVIGVGLGLLAAWPLLRLLTSQLFGVTPTDPITLVGVALVLTLVGVFAAICRRGARPRSTRSSRCGPGSLGDHRRRSSRLMIRMPLYGWARHFTTRVGEQKGSAPLLALVADPAPLAPGRIWGRSPLARLT